jgi:hypothetical protein
MLDCVCDSHIDGWIYSESSMARAGAGGAGRRRVVCDEVHCGRQREAATGRLLGRRDLPPFDSRGGRVLRDFPSCASKLSRNHLLPLPKARHLQLIEW